MEGGFADIWNTTFPIKINVFMWRVMLDETLNRVELDRRWIDVDYLLCPVCREEN